MEKHTSYYNLLEQLDEADCPICAQLESSLKNFLDSYLYEGVTDRENWDRLTRSNGYCARHCAMLENFSDGLAVALVYRHLVRQSLKTLGRKTKGSWFKKKKTEPCPACDYETGIEQDQALLLAQALEEEEFRQKFEKHPGLCLVHAHLVAAHGGAGKKETAARLEALCAELDEFVRKSDHLNTEKMGSEGDSWKRVLRKFHGLRYGQNWNK